MNNDVKVLLFQLTEIFAIPNWIIKENCPLYSFQIDNEYNSLVFLT